MKKKIRHPRRSGLRSILLSLIGLGTSGCIAPVMYGTPYAEWSVKGKVVDETNCPVRGLQVVLGNRFENSESVIYDVNYQSLDTLHTASDGTYQVAREGFPLHHLEIHVKDIDGPQNGGEFEDAGLIIKDIVYKGAKGWYSGSADIIVPDIIVKRK